MKPKLYTKETLETKITSLLVALRPESQSFLELETDLFQAGILDSFGIIEFIAALEEEFNIQITNDDLVPQNLVTIASTTTLVEKYLVN